MVVNARSLKRLKRRHTADLYDFLTFPSSSTDSFYDDGRICGPGPFRLNIKEFLTRHALLPPPSSLFPHLTTWQLLFRFGDHITAGAANDTGSDSFPVVVSLDVVEEDVARSRSVYCDQCRVVGWSEHPVCAKRYHFIVKADGRTSIGGFVKPCIKCGFEIHLSEPKCKVCNHVMTSVDVEDLVYNQLEDTSHLLHGVIHANGYGHLLRINGREGGSRALSGSQIMDFWDRLCKYLGVRKISVMDVSKKYGLEYRLLHAITKGHPWYGNWGYEFGAGSFALTQKSYKEAVDRLSNLPLSIFICQGRKPRTYVQDLILYYQSLSEHELVNVRDLFCVIMSLIHDPEKMPPNSDETHKKHGVAVPGVLCAWTSNDIKRVEEAMYRVLLAVSGSNWVSWRTLRGAVCKSGPLELLDYCLKELQGKQPADGMVITARCNPETGAVEYRLERGNAVSLGNPTPAYPPFINCPSKEHLTRDLRYLYESLLHPHSMLSFGPEARRDLAVGAAARLLDCKQFVKDYRPETMLPFANPTVMFLLCQVELPDSEDEYATIPPPEMIPLPLTATISDFKLEASKTFQEVYIIFKGFHGEELPDYGGVDESTLVRLLFRPFQTVSLSGKCPMRNGLARFKMERGIERWTVDCTCGAKDDDGERMLACDACGVWQHTRCAGIPDFDAVPAKFVCDRCRNLVKVAKVTSHCKGEVTGGGGGSGGGKSLAALFGVR